MPPLPEQDACLAMPLAGTAEGWPAVAADALAYLAEQGVGLIGTDAPSLSGVDPALAQQLDWFAASRELTVVAMLTGLEAIADREAFFLFAPIKIAGTRGGYGRGLALVEPGPEPQP